MTDQLTTPLSAIAGNDQRMTEITDTAGRVAMYFKLLTGNGVPEDRAAEMVGEYNSMVIARHFQATHEALRTVPTFYTGEDD